MKQVVFEVQCSAVDMQRLRSFAVSNARAARSARVEHCVWGALIDTSLCARDAGLAEPPTIVVTAVPGQIASFRARFTAKVRDEERVVEAAQERHAQAWTQDQWRAATLGEAVFDLLIGSWKNPHPSRIGLEFVGVEYLENPAYGGTPSDGPGAEEVVAGMEL